MINFIYSLQRKRINIWTEDDNIKIFILKGSSLLDIEKNFLINNKKDILDILRANKVYKRIENVILKSDLANPVLSFAQERLRFIDLYEKGTFAYLIPILLELKENVNLDCLKKSIQSIVNRHEILRTVFRKDEKGLEYQKILDEPLEIKENIIENIDKNINVVFDLEKNYPIQITLYHPSLLLINAHHIAFDGWSMDIMIKELESYYLYYAENIPLNLPELDIQYKDFAFWQREYLKEEILNRHLNYWKNRLLDFETLAFPIDKPRPPKIDYNGDIYIFDIEKDISNRVRLLAKEKGKSLYTLLLSSFCMLLNKYTGQEDLCIGTPFANRNHPQIINLIGFFANTLPLRIKIKPDMRFDEIIENVHRDLIELQEYQDIPFEKLVDFLQIERDQSRNPIFQTVFLVQSFGQKTTSNLFKPLNVEDYYKIAKFEISLAIDDNEEQLKGKIFYKTSLYNKSTVKRLKNHFINLLSQVVSNPNIKLRDINILSKEEYEVVINKWNQTYAPYPKDKTIQELFEEYADKNPDNIAVVFENKKTTYKELNEKSNQLAHYLIKAYKIKPDTFIAFGFERSLDMIIAILGIIKSGGAYVPIDINYPKDRIEYILNDCNASLYLTEIPKIEDFPKTNLNKINTSKDLAYAIYTSGTTGKPKGVMIEHRAVVSLVKNPGYANFSENDVFLFYSNPVFDALTFEVWGPLLNGSKMAILLDSLNIISDTQRFKNILEIHQISVLWITRSLFDNLYERDNHIFDSLKYLITGGETLTPKIISKICSQDKRPQFVLNGYGPTEATTFSTTYLCNKEYLNNIPIGKPLNNRFAYILDKNLNPVPVGVYGELYVGGDGVGRGYLNNIDLTKERFIPNPFALGILYKTGDIVRWLDDGNIEYKGRTDFQIKLRGFRIELHEIENALLNYTGISRASVILKDKKYLTAYYVSDLPVDNDKLTSHLASILPEYMIPSFFIHLKELPITLNGKLDMKALPEPEIRGDSSDNYLEPRDEIEILLCSIWKQVLGIEKIGIKDDFFRIGGDSILSIQLASMIRKNNIDISVRDIFDYRTIERMTEYVKSSKKFIKQDLDKISLYSESNLFQTVNISQTLIDKLQNDYDIEAVNPANSLQQGFVYHSLNSPNDDAYRVQIIFDYYNKLDLLMLKRSWELTIETYPVLRTCFNWDEQLIQITDKKVYIDWFEHDISLKKDKDYAISEIQRKDRENGFDLTQPGLLRIHLIKQSDEHYTCIKSEHHSILDGWSFPIILKKVHQFYNKLTLNENIEIKEDTVYLESQRYFYHNMEKVEKYWKDKLRLTQSVNDIGTILSFPVDLDNIRSISNSKERILNVGDDIYSQLKGVVKKEGLTLNVLMQFAWHKLIQTYTQDLQTIVGTTLSGRDIPIDGIEDSVGLYINTLPLIINWSEKTVKEQLKSIHDEITGINSNSFVNLASLQKEGKRLFHTLFIFENYPLPNKKDNKGLNIEFKEIIEKLDYPLCIIAYEFNQHLYIKLKYSSDYLEEEKAERVLNQIKLVLKQIPSNIDKSWGLINLLDEEEYDLVINKWNKTESPYPKDKTIHELFEEQVNKTPDYIAVVFNNKTLTYRELNEKANQIANLIRKSKEKDIVGIYTERSLSMIAGILGILKSGGSYLPFDTSEPIKRIIYKLNDSGLDIILTSSELEANLKKLVKDDISIIVIDSELDNADKTNPNIINRSKDLAYVLYTSGSTGEPKGVMVEHKSVINTIYALKDVYKLDERTNKVAAYSSYTFDVSVSEFFVTLLQGGELHILDDDTKNDAIRLSSYIKDNKINYIFLPPAILSVLPDYVYESLEGIIFAGEACNQEVGRYWGERYRLYNYYGPTETTIYATGTRAINENVNIIGKPISNNYAYILDTHLNPVPIGVIGELYIGGDGLARGYLKRPDLTDDRFINLSTKNQRVYKTGDLARWRFDGNIEFIGRNDSQIKLRGFRIELGEVEAKLEEHPNISKCVVLVKERDNNKYLSAYYVSDKILSNDDLIEHLSISLPEYMIPKIFISLNTFPLTVSGKIDRLALPEPDFKGERDFYKAPETELERVMAKIWEKVLGLETIGIKDDFFKLGGDSILSILLSSKLRNNNVNISVRDIFEHRTIEKLSKYISTKIDLKKEGEQGVLEGYFDLLPVQKWFFEKGFKKNNHFNQAILCKTTELSIERLKNAINKIVSHHDALRLSFNKDGVQYYNQNITIPEIKCLDVSGMDIKNINQTLTEWQSCFEIVNTPLWQFGYLYGYNDKSARLFLSLHHLIEDAVSLRILIEDIKDIYDGKKLSAKTSSYREWVETVKEYAEKNKQELSFWHDLIAENYYKNISDTIARKEVILYKETSDILIYKSNIAYNTQINDLLLTALAYSIKEWNGLDINYITLEGHGREYIKDSIDVSRTVGWFTTMYPVKLAVESNLSQTIKNIKESLRKIPNKGLGYGALKYYGDDEKLKKHKLPTIIFNYLGSFIYEDSGISVHPENHIDTLLNINAILSEGNLIFKIAGKLTEYDLSKFSESLISNLKNIAIDCSEKRKTEYTPSDFDTVKISQSLLDKLQSKYEIDSIYPANSLQQGFIYHALSYPKDDAYRIQIMFDYYNKLDAELLKKGWEIVIKIYPIFRTFFNWEEELIQITDKKVHLNWFYHDISNISDKCTALKDIQEKDRKREFNLKVPGLFRLYLIKQSEEHYTFLTTVHHSIFDGWSTPFLLKKVHDIYKKLVKAEEVKITEDRVYLDAQEYFSRNRKVVDKYWEDKIKVIESVNDINDFFSIKSDLDNIKSIKNEKEQILNLDDKLYKDLKDLLQKEGITINSILQFAWHKLIQSYTRDKQTIVGTIISGRDLPLNGIEESVGLFINTLPLIVEWGNKTIRKQLQDIHAEITVLNNNSYVNLGSLQKEGKRVFHTLFVFENYPRPKTFDSEFLNIKFKHPVEKLDYPVCLLASERDNNLSIKLKYAGEYIDDEKAKKLLKQIDIILKQITSNKIDQLCSSITLVSDYEYELLVNNLNKKKIFNTDSKTIHEAFYNQVIKTPDNIALVFGSEKLTYKELNSKSNQLAHYIRFKYKELTGEDLLGNTLIGLYLDRSIEIITGVLGILKAGAAYVPFDAVEPADRIKYKIEDSRCRIVITSSNLMDNLKGNILLIPIDLCKEELERALDTNPVLINRSEDLAYVIYTSGTTGNSKGSLITHNNVLRLFKGTDKHFSFTESDVWSLFHAISFDFTVWEIWGALFYGGKLIIPTFQETRDTSLFYDLLQRYKVTVLNQTPSSFTMLSQFDIDNEKRLDSLRYVIFGGEALNVLSLLGWIDKYGTEKPELINMYGITETTVHVTYKRLSRKDIESGITNIGKPLPDLTSYVLNESLQPVPVGLFGELYIGGAGLCKGYLNRPELNKEKFIPNPFIKDEILYKTGDIVRLLDNFDLEYKGRNDSQIKIRGFRIELGEIERKILEQEGVKQSVVMIYEKGEKKQIIAYYTGSGIPSDIIRKKISTLLPDYMIPSYFIEIDKIPLTVNGKIDKRALPEPAINLYNKNYVSPRNETEKEICDMWAKLLGLERVGIYDDFFLIGGDSIISIKVASRMKEAGFQLSVRDLFVHKNIASLLANINKTDKMITLNNQNNYEWEF
ncbi:MAG: amino acid adenylation domain-containing protein [Desulfobacterales bacterium]|nr:amino acid adenylation domain-containing protein [Desulfobacterales bacterium]